MSPIVKKKGEKFTLPSKYLLFILSLLCTVLMVVSFTTDALDRPVNAVAGFIIVPFQKGISNVGTYIHDRSEELAKIKELLEENESLKEQVDKLTEENTRLQEDKYELNNLRSLYKIDKLYDEYDKTGARIIARDAGNFYHTFIIDKGSVDGIEVDMNVLADGGLVGRVSGVGRNWARVVSVIADNSNISGKVLSTNDTLIVSGNLKTYESAGCVDFSQLIDASNAVQIGDKITTGDISDKFLPDILIGYVNDVKNDSNNLTKSGTITPAVDFAHLSEVLIILEKKQTVDDD